MESKAPNKPEVWTLTQFLGAAFEPAEPIVENLIHKGELILMSATAKTGKSLVAANLALAVATGTELFLGKFPVHKSRVLLLQTEISRWNFQQRLFQMVGHFPKIPILENLLITDVATKIDNPEGRKVLIELISAHQPDLLILDPFYTLHSKDEDSSSEMAPLLAWLKQVVNKRNLATLLIHHQGKKGEMDSKQVGHRHRGSSAFADVPDGSISLQKTPTKGQATISFELRNSDAVEPITLQLGENLWWSAIDTPLIVESEQYDVASLIGESEMVTRTCLVERFLKKYRKSERTAHSKISLSVSRNKITKTEDETGIWYSRTRNITSLQTANSLGELHSAVTHEQENLEGLENDNL